MSATAPVREEFDPKTRVALFDIDKDDIETKEWEGTFAEFVTANEIEAEEAAEIAEILISTGVRYEGGGAMTLSALRIAKVAA